jgi:Flp pilus assembly protein TadD
MVGYLTALNTLVPRDDAIRKHFGEDLAAVDASLRSYSRQGRKSSGALELGTVPEVTLPQPQPMSDGDALAALIDVMLVTRRQPDRTRTLVESLRRREPDAARSYILAARLAELENDAAAFDTAMEKAASLLKADDQAGRRDLGTLLLNSALEYGRADARGTEQFDRNLKRALKWFAEAVERDNGDPKALWGLGATLTQLDSELDLADTALQAAYEKVPASADIATSLANLKHRQDKPEEAVRYLNDVVRFADDLSLRRWATESLQRTQEYIEERKRIEEENRRQREAYEKQLAEYERKYGKPKKKK